MRYSPRYIRILDFYLIIILDHFKVQYLGMCLWKVMLGNLLILGSVIHTPFLYSDLTYVL